jgi:hypothetical protein
VFQKEVGEEGGCVVISNLGNGLTPSTKESDSWTWKRVEEMHTYFHCNAADALYYFPHFYSLILWDLILKLIIKSCLLLDFTQNNLIL